MTVKVDSHTLVIGDIPFTVGLKFRKLLTILFIPNCMEEFCPEPSFYQLLVVAARPSHSVS